MAVSKESSQQRGKKGNYFFGVALFFLVLSVMLWFSSQQLTGRVIQDFPFTVITVSFIFSIFLSFTVYIMTVVHDRERYLAKEKYILEENKDDFLSIAAHQIRTPLGSNKWKLEMLLHGDFGKLNQQTKQAIEQLLKNNQHMIALANNLLEVSSLEEKRTADAPALVNMEDTIKKVLGELKTEVRQKKLRIRTHVAAKKNFPLHIDEHKLYAVVENILSNAVKYNIKQGKIDISLTQNPRWTTLQVKDTGIGIPPVEEARVFTKFFRAPNAIHTDTDGSGLGLYVVKSYIDAWGGEVHCEKNAPAGTIMTVKIPNNT